jgi:transposase
MKKSKAMIDQILAMHKQGVSIRKIARALGLSRNTVRGYVRVKAPSDKEIVPSEKPLSSWDLDFPWDHVLDQRRRGVTCKQLYLEMQPAISYPHFARIVRQRLKPSPTPALRLDHEPGQRVQIDFCDGPLVRDPRTNKPRKTYLFCAVLPFSSYTYAEIVFDQKLATFIACHQRMWSFFGGITPYVVVDNLKSGVKNAHRYDPDVNPTYCDFGNQCGFAVLPARPYTPRDKASCEAAIGVIQRTFFQEIRDESFYDKAQINDRLRPFLEKLNTAVMKDHGVSRNDRFAVERPLLLPLKGMDYEILEWRTAKVHPDSCIQVDKCLYSVPFHYIGQRLRVRTGPHTIEVFNADLASIACHKRLQRPGASSILEGHLPSYLQQSQSFDIRKAKAKSESIDPKTTELVELLFSDSRPLRHLRRVLGIIRLRDQGFSNESIEYGSAQALCFHRYQLSYIKACAESFKSNGGAIRSTVPVRDPTTIHLHGGV